MKGPMRAALTVAPGRFSGPGEIERLLDPIRPAVAAAFRVEDWLPPPMPWLQWLEWRDLAEPGEFAHPGHVLIGYDLPPALRRPPVRWVDLGQHPCRFAGQWWSVVDSAGPLDAWALDEAGLNDLVAPLPPQARREEDLGGGVFAAQVSFDGALMYRGRPIRPADVIEGLRAFAHRFDRLVVAPHPLEPEGPWVAAALDLPRAELAAEPTYDLLRRVREVCTVTSSVGAEAPYFGCRTTYLSAPRPYGAPLRTLADPRLWELVHDRAKAAA